jgi:hypothetical protein
VYIDLKPVENGTLYEDFDMLPPKKIKVIAARAALHTLGGAVFAEPRCQSSCTACVAGTVMV